MAIKKNISSENDSRYIAIIISNDSYDYYDGYAPVIQSITDWERVTNAEFRSLTAASGRLGFKLLERPDDMSKFIKKSISDWKALVKEDEIREAAYKEELSKKKEAKAMKAALKKVNDKRKLLQQLKEELGDI